MENPADNLYHVKVYLKYVSLLALLQRLIYIYIYHTRFNTKRKARMFFTNSLQANEIPRSVNRLNETTTL